MRAATHEPPLPRGDHDERVLILAPRGRNAELIERTLRKATFKPQVCGDVAGLCDELAQPTGLAIVCEEAFTRQTLDHLIATLSRQPPWSDVPVVVLTGGGRATRGSLRIATALGSGCHVTLMERPVRIITLLSAVRAALRARRRQYEVRDLLDLEHAARAQAERASRAKDHFLATLSHELRTPLNPVLIAVSAMLDDPRLPEYFREDVDLIKRNVDLEAKLIDDLLDLTRIARGKLELRQDALNLHDLLRHATAECCESDIRRKRIRLTTHLRASHPYVWGDAARLSQVFWNLIRNAVKFTPEGGKIILGTANDDAGGLVVTVADTGIGIEPSVIDRIFDAFEQGDRSITRRFGGLGLGLAICKALLALHGGTISAESGGRDAGSAFTVRLQSIPAPLAGPAPPGGAAAAIDGDGRDCLRILLVEDHQQTALVMARLLRSHGHVVAVANDVASARTLFAPGRFDVIVSDLGLPDGNGHDLIRHLRSTGGDTPAIAISGYGMEEDVRQSRDAGFDEHLVKPIDVNKLTAAIRRVRSART